MQVNISAETSSSLRCLSNRMMRHLEGEKRPIRRIRIMQSFDFVKASMFDEAQKEVIDLMRLDCLPRFQSSKFYNQVKEEEFKVLSLWTVKVLYISQLTSHTLCVHMKRARRNHTGMMYSRKYKVCLGGKSLGRGNYYRGLYLQTNLHRRHWHQQNCFKITSIRSLSICLPRKKFNTSSFGDSTSQITIALAAFKPLQMGEGRQTQAVGEQRPERKLLEAYVDPKSTIIAIAAQSLIADCTFLLLAT